MVGEWEVSNRLHLTLANHHLVMTSTSETQQKPCHDAVTGQGMGSQVHRLCCRRSSQLSCGGPENLEGTALSGLPLGVKGHASAPSGSSLIWVRMRASRSSEAFRVSVYWSLEPRRKADSVPNASPSSETASPSAESGGSTGVRDSDARCRRCHMACLEF